MLDGLDNLFGDNDSSKPYECRACGEQYKLQHHSCPECGSYNIERINWETETDVDPEN